jgi:hypothetical protein
MHPNFLFSILRENCYLNKTNTKDQKLINYINVMYMMVLKFIL